MDRRIRLVRTAFPGRPAFDTAVSRALLLRAADGGMPQTLRLWRPDPIVAFGRRDAVAPGFTDAVRAARRCGFDGVLRLAGGRAAVFHEGTIAFARAVPDADATSRTFARFDETAEILTAALRRLGIDARVGEIPGEYCPGDHSVNAGGRTKLAGIGQRLIAGAAHVGGVVVVEGADRVRDVLVPVYAALGLSWDPQTAGAVADERPVTWTDVEAAVVEAFGSRYDVEEDDIDATTLELAARLEADHRVEDASPTGG
jgi:lipoate-protein ligase A